MENGFRILEHPADIGIEAYGINMGEAFRQAALGLLGIIVDPLTVEPLVRKEIAVSGSDSENLLVKWLSEILYLFDGEGFVSSEVEIVTHSPTAVRAILLGEPIQVQKHGLRTDVKAITYHQLRVDATPDGVTVRVYLDI